MDKKTKIIVIGGGPAGMMAAIQASKNNENEVVLLEQNEKLGKKLFITGKGRCNITNSVDISEFFENIPRNKEFMYSALYGYTNDDLVGFFHEYGVQTKVEREIEFFPLSDKSSDVIKALENAMRKNGVDIQLNTQVKSIGKYDSYFNIKTNRDSYECDKLIIATGGLSYPVTGSTGDGYSFGKKFGHTVSELYPALVPIELDDKDLEELQGLSIKNAEMYIKVNGKVKHSEFGEFLFAHYGITGPIVLTLSQFLSDYKKSDIEISCNFKPALDEKTLDLRLLREFNENANKQIITVMYNLLPKSLAGIVLKRSRIDASTPCNQITKQNRTDIINNIRNFTFKYKSLADIKLAIITKGGMNLKEINSSTMESKLVENLYFCGEILDVNGFTGGFNLQIAFSTGYLAGISV